MIAHYRSTAKILMLVCVKFYNIILHIGGCTIVYNNSMSIIIRIYFKHYSYYQSKTICFSFKPCLVVDCLFLVVLLQIQPSSFYFEFVLKFLCFDDWLLVSTLVHSSVWNNHTTGHTNGSTYLFLNNED